MRLDGRVALALIQSVDVVERKRHAVARRSDFLVGGSNAVFEEVVRV